MSEALPPAHRTRLWETLTRDAEDHLLRLQVCDHCATVQYPPRDVCRRCLADALSWQRQDGRGKVLAVSQLHTSLNEWFNKRLPWAVASVHLEAGPTVICHAPTSIQAGDLVRLENRTDPSGQSSLHAIPLEEET